jgi:hypothetical protein
VKVADITVTKRRNLNGRVNELETNGKMNSASATDIELHEG